LTEQGIKYRKKRSIEPESVFGQIKQDKVLRRFSIRSLAKVEIEFGLVSIAHNLQKLWKWLLNTENKEKLDSFITNFASKSQILEFLGIMEENIFIQYKNSNLIWQKKKKRLSKKDSSFFYKYKF